MSAAEDNALHAVNEAIETLQDARHALHLAYPDDIIHERINRSINEMIELATTLNEPTERVNDHAV
jgi:hypothetical protein